MSDTKLVTVYEAQGMLAAQIVKGRLESAGIPAMLKYEAVGQVYGLTVDGLGLVRVQVPAAFADDALVALEADDAEDAANSPAGSVGAAPGSETHPADLS